MQAAFIQEHAANPFGFDVAAFISSEAKRWGCPEAEISSVIDPLLPSVSGGKEWLLLEKAMTSGMDTNDTNKLYLYYKDCWAEFLDRAPSSFFMYIAGGFDGKDAASVLNTLERCTQKYGRPVCAITVNAMLRLVRPEAMVRTFSLRAYYPSAESIIRASA